MEVIRIKLKQSKAHYGRPECVENRMTYPLPPYSTIIGALHNVCGYTEYREMNISVQGKFKSMQKEVHNQHILLNHREDDRGILIHLQNPNMLSSGYKIVARALKKQGNSFKNNETIRIVDKEYMQKYWNLLEIKGKLDEEYKLLKGEKTIAKQEEKKHKEYLKKLDKNSDEYLRIDKELKDKKRKFKEEEVAFKEKRDILCDNPLSHFQTLTISPRYIEVLYGVELVLHIQSKESVLSDIEKSINNFTCLGRSEDFVDILECKKVNIEKIEKKYETKEFAGYIDKELLENGTIVLADKKTDFEKINTSGTTYYIPKNYKIKGEKRQFEFKKVVYISEYTAYGESNNDEQNKVFIDKEGDYIVNLV